MPRGMMVTLYNGSACGRNQARTQGCDMAIYLDLLRHYLLRLWRQSSGGEWTSRILWVLLGTYIALNCFAIGLMADRILITQQIQNDNVALTQQNILTAQTNVIGLVAQIDTSACDLELAN